MCIESRSPASVGLNIINVCVDIQRIVSNSSSAVLLVMESHIMYGIFNSKSCISSYE